MSLRVFSVVYSMMKAFSENDLARFHEQGFLIFRGLAPPETVATMRTAAETDLAASRGPVELEADVHYPGAPAASDAPGGDTVRRLLRAFERDSSFRNWALSPQLLNTARRLLGDDDIRLVQAHHNCIMTKHPRFSSATHWHQDIRYWRFTENALVNAWTALGDETRDNGCMRVIPGSHRMNLKPERFDEARFFRRDLAENRALIKQAVRCELAAGDVLFFHSGLLHAAGRNLAGERKLAVVFTYRSADNPPEAGTRSASLPDIVPEI